MYYIYILYSRTSDKYYVGYSDDPFRRLKEHNTSSFNTYTSKHRPWEFAVLFECGSERSAAMKTEKFIKNQKSRRFIEQLITAKNLHSSLAHLVRVPHMRD